MYKKQELYTAGDSRIVFEILEHYLVENDAWVRYTNTQTLKEYTCRLEAFLQRFQPLSV
jgi:hypothetical protein